MKSDCSSGFGRLRNYARNPRYWSTGRKKTVLLYLDIKLVYLGFENSLYNNGYPRGVLGELHRPKAMNIGNM